MPQPKMLSSFCNLSTTLFLLDAKNERPRIHPCLKYVTQSALLGKDEQPSITRY